MTEDNEIQELRERLIRVEAQVAMLMSPVPEKTRSFVYDFVVGFVVVLGAILLTGVIVFITKQIF